MIKFFKKIWRKAWLVSVIALIMIAFLLSIVRAVTPWLANHKNELELIASNQLQMPVTIDQVKSSWYGLTPVIELDKISIKTNEEQKQPVLKIKRVYIGIDIFKSLRNWRIEVGKLTVSGLEITLQENSQGKWLVKGFEKLSGDQQLETQQIAKIIWDRLIHQSYISLRNVYLHLIPQNGKDIHIKQMSLLWQSDKEFHRLTGQSILQKKQATQVRFLLQIIGNELDQNKLEATIYLQLKSLLLPSWINDMNWKGLTISSGIADVDLTGRISKGQLQLVQTNFDVENLTIQSSNKKILLKSAQGMGEIQWKKMGLSEWELNANSMNWKIEGKRLPEQSLSINYQKSDPQTSVRIEGKSIVLTPLIKVLVGSSLLSAQQQKMLNSLQPKGLIQDIDAKLDFQEKQLQDFQFQSHFASFSLKKWQKYPGIENLTGYLSLDKSQGMALLNSEKGSINLQPLFRKNLPFDLLTAKVIWKKQDQLWQVMIPNIHYQIDGIKMDGEIGITQQLDNEMPYVDSIVNIKATNLNHEQVARYLPATLIPDAAIKWLDEAFVKIDRADAKAILRGPLNQFPFDHDQGVFIVDGKFYDAKLNYQKGWPLAENLYGSLKWRGRGVEVELKEGTLDQLHLENVAANIPYIGTEEGVLLYLNGNSKTDISKPLNYLKKTPLVHLFNDKFSQLSGEGDINLSLALVIPINDDKQPEVKYTGELLFKGVDLSLPHPEVEIENLVGKINFSDKKLLGKGLTAELFSNPASINITMQEKYPFIEVHGKAKITDVENIFNTSLKNFLQGSSDYHLSILPDETGVNIKIESTLEGITSELPAPLNKTMKKATPSNVNLYFGKDENIKIQFQLNNYISGALQYTALDKTLSSVKIHFDQEQAQFSTTPGLIIDGKAPIINWDKWQAFLKEINQKNTSLNGLKLQGVNVSFPSFNFLGQTFSNVYLGLNTIEDGWEIAIQGDEIAGTMTIPNDYMNKQIAVNLGKLYLKTPFQKDEKQTNDLKNMPPIEIKINDFQYQDMKLGRISTRLIRNNNGIQISDLLVRSSAFKLQASGFYNTQNPISTSLKGTMSSSNVRKALQQWGLPGHIESSNGELSFDLNWIGSIADFAFPNLQGNISIHIDKGAITGLSKDTDVKLGLGRLVTLLSLQSLPKRLQLNFKDLTSKGYFFDKLRGDFSLGDGLATTKNGFLQGPVAQVDLLGSIDMKEQTYDLTLKVLPNMTSSLPVVATIAGGPVVGAVTWVADKLVGKQVNKINQHVYRITGPWNEPKIDPVKHYYREVSRQPIEGDPING